MNRLLLVLLASAMILLAGCASPDDDPDADGLKSSQEAGGRDISITRADGTIFTRHVTSDPKLKDTDGDGLEDLDEAYRGSDPRDVDTDGDGLLDGHDVLPENAPEGGAAWIARGILRGEVGQFLGELDRCVDLALKPTQASSDLPVADKLGDGDELLGWNVSVRGETRRVVSDPCTPDADHDGLADDEEKAFGTDPSQADTDGDGVRDGFDVDPLWNVGVRITNVTVARTNGTGDVLLTFLSGAGTQSIRVPDNSTLDLEASDITDKRDTLLTQLIVSAEDAATGERLALFPDARGHIFAFDLVKGIFEGGSATLVLEGADGSVTLSGSTLRR